jgi:hypothetical protein
LGAHYSEMANAVANLHPTAGIPNQEKEMNGHYI